MTGLLVAILCLATLAAGSQLRGKRPVLLITAGPTGAGKSGIPRAAERVTGVRAEDYETFLVDDLIEADSHYKWKVLKILYRIRASTAARGQQAQDEVMREALTHPTRELTKEFDDAYFASRRHGDCDHPDESKINGIDSGCSGVFKNRLANAIAARKNIVFETTVNFPTWLIDRVGEAYDIYYSASLVGFCNLTERNTERAFKQAKAFLEDPLRRRGARLPDVAEGGPFLERTLAFSSTLQRLYADRCTAPPTADAPSADFCGKYPLKGVLLFDNNVNDGLFLAANFAQGVPLPSPARYAALLSCSLATWSPNRATEVFWDHRRK